METEREKLKIALREIAELEGVLVKLEHVSLQEMAGFKILEEIVKKQRQEIEYLTNK